MQRLQRLNFCVSLDWLLKKIRLRVRDCSRLAPFSGIAGCSIGNQCASRLTWKLIEEELVTIVNVISLGSWRSWLCIHCWAEKRTSHDRAAVERMRLYVLRRLYHHGAAGCAVFEKSYSQGPAFGTFNCRDLFTLLLLVSQTFDFGDFRW